MASASMKELLDNRKKEANINSLQCTVTSSNRDLTVVETRQFVETLDRRVYTNEKYLPWYCKAVRALGKQKVLICQSMALDPTVKNNERMFTWLLKQELQAAK